MERIIRPIARIYSQDAAYRNFIRNEYRRRLAAHHEEPASKEEEPPLGRSGEALRFVSRHRFASVALVIMVIAALVLYAQAIVSAAAFIALLVIASVSTVYKRKMGMPLGGIEMVTFGTVVSGVAFGPVAGLVFGVVSSIASEIISANIGPLTWIYVINMAVVGFLAGILSGLNLVFLGMSAAVITLLINQVIYLFIGDEEMKSMTVFYLIANLSFNAIVFSTIGPRVVALLV